MGRACRFWKAERMKKEEGKTAQNCQRPKPQTSPDAFTPTPGATVL